jgi:hypothetical protein
MCSSCGYHGNNPSKVSNGSAGSSAVHSPGRGSSWPPQAHERRRNREAIAIRETRVAIRLRAVEHAYRDAIERDSINAPSEPTRTFRLDHVTGRQLDLEAEP